MATSVGLGYIAEFFIDFGFPGMFVPLFFYGCLITLMVYALQRYSPSYDLFAAGATAILGGLNSLDANVAKIWGGMLSTTIVFCVFLHFCGGWLHRRHECDVLGMGAGFGLETGCGELGEPGG